MQRKTRKKRWWFIALVLVLTGTSLCIHWKTELSWIQELSIFVMPEPEFKHADEEIAAAVADLLANSPSTNKVSSQSPR